VRITGIDTHHVGAGWKNWLFVVVHTDEGLDGLGEGTLNGLTRSIGAAVDELSHLAIGEDPRDVRRLQKRLLERVSNDGGHIHRTAVAAIETACWDILGKSLDAPVHRLLGGPVRVTVPAYANGWYRTERTPEGFVAAAEAAVERGFRALKLDPFGTAQGFLDDSELDRAYRILAALRERFGPDLRLLIDVHARFTEAEALRAAHRLAPLGLFWWEEPCTREREEPTNRVGRASPIPVASGETFHLLGQFLTLIEGGGVSILQPEPMSLGGISTALAVADLAAAAGAYVAPHQSGGPVATAVCLQLAACVPNFLIQEHFDPFNEPWTSELVTWTPEIDPTSGELSLPLNRPGIGLELDLGVVRAHPYDPTAYLDIWSEGWERRLGQPGAGHRG
jgi:galactonate dehydratase